ncbi:hypothetical protein ES703_12690 [subsurface metagenome]
MQSGVFKHWTPQAEEYYASVLNGCSTFAQRHLVLLIRDILKYDGRTREAKRALAQARLRLAVATDTDLEELVKLEMTMEKEGSLDIIPDRLEYYKQVRANIIEKGIERKELE